MCRASVSVGRLRGWYVSFVVRLSLGYFADDESDAHIHAYLAAPQIQIMTSNESATECNQEKLLKTSHVLHTPFLVLSHGPVGATLDDR